MRQASGCCGRRGGRSDVIAVAGGRRPMQNDILPGPISVAQHQRLFTDFDEPIVVFDVFTAHI